MYLGKIVESGVSDEIYRHAQHPYTQSLISAIPIPDPHNKSDRQIITGDVPSPIDPPSGCAFHPRCPKAQDTCKNLAPLLIDRVNTTSTACHLILEPPSI
ncbi:MAG: ABC transporter ATP-binding protein [Pseudomonadales bacterium]|nr:ABC transporter ATP-binding protein [Pseudomonadales bacterium]